MENKAAYETRIEYFEYLLYTFTVHFAESVADQHLGFHSSFCLLLPRT